MKILFTGGGSGGHFYPVIAVAEAINEIVRERKLLEPQLYYAAPDPYDREMLLANNITFVPTAAGKVRRYWSPLNIIDFFKTAWGTLRSVLRIFFLYPDVVFGTGGYASFPTLLAARLFRIPVVVYATDVVPSRVNIWAGKFAVKVAVSFEEAAKYFPQDKVAFTGNPIRKSILVPSREGGYDFFKLRSDLPVVLVIGASQGAVALNEVVLSGLPQLLEKYQIVHQTGNTNIKEVEGRAKIVMGNSPLLIERYRPFGYLNDLALRNVSGIASIVVSRAGAGGIFEIANWGLPSIIIPIPESISRDQTKNAYAYARSGAATVIDQNNLTPGVLTAEIERILGNENIRHKMREAAREFGRADASKTIASALIEIAISHEL
ncbi:MAG TPA: UDP-N-acetylglucosamine--N-acetylmuramyl-(pentapeptide) pyrophosphoryl-undecaprenol N-acetylglucosamine transferase [Candidatus Paceibacterota bacterium]|nr:UDP-N-acetylglucosamine--N-acetylmuramyl-(pentapeptide) pyrophosphoryl-undecaprenol N-acetylglucosamine transferase [Candidatus Paceibacterota bacterium]